MCSHTFDTSINGVPRIVKEWYDDEYRDLPTHLISRGALIIRKMCLLLIVVVLLCECSNIMITNRWQYFAFFSASLERHRRPTVQQSKRRHFQSTLPVGCETNDPLPIYFIILQHCCERVCAFTLTVTKFKCLNIYNGFRKNFRHL